MGRPQRPSPPRSSPCTLNLPGSQRARCGGRRQAGHGPASKPGFRRILDYIVALDTTLAVSEGVREISSTLWQALALVVVVVFIFLQGWRATLIPLLAVAGFADRHFRLLPLFGFSVNTLSLFGARARDRPGWSTNAIVVVEAVGASYRGGAKSPATRPCRRCMRWRVRWSRSRSSSPPCSSPPRSSPASPAGFISSSR